MATPALARTEPSLIMRSSAWVALICVNDTDDGARHSNCATAKKSPGKSRAGLANRFKG